MIKNSVFLTILILSLPLAVFGDNNVDFTNSRGTLSGTNSGLTLAGSTIIAVNGLGSGLITGTDLGTLSFRTGNLSSGSLQMGGTLAAGGAFKHHRQRNQRHSEWRDLQRLFHGTVDLDASDALQWDAQLHSDRFFVGNLAEWHYRQWRHCPADH